MPTNSILAHTGNNLPTSKASSYLVLGKSTLDKLRLTGGGPVYIQIGKRVVYDVADLDAWAAQHKRTQTAKRTRAAPSSLKGGLGA